MKPGRRHRPAFRSTVTPKITRRSPGRSSDSAQHPDPIHGDIMKLKTILRALGASATASLLAAASAPAVHAQTVLKMAHIYTPGNIWYETAEAYAKAVEQKSGGKVKIQI